MNFTTVILATLLFACPLIVLTTAGILNTRAGIANFGFDGLICVGAAVYCLTISELRSSLGIWALVIAFLLSLIVGAIFSFIFSFATVTCQADQIMISMILNFLGYALAILLPIAFMGTVNFSNPQLYANFNPVLAIVLTLVIIYLVAILLLLTKFGLHIKALGQNPVLAALNYIKVRRLRYIISLFSCSLACLSGALLVYVDPTLFVANNNFSGLGFIVIALWMVAKSRFVLASIICLVFSFCYQMFIFLQTLSSVVVAVPGWFLAMVPYLITLIFLMVVRIDTKLPNSWGLPYIKNLRDHQ